MKPLCVIQAPYATRSGYGDMARDLIRHVIDMNRYEVKLVSMPWGGTPLTALDPVNDSKLIEYTQTPPVQLSRPPEVFIQISVPNEFQPIGKYNIGITAGIETTICSPEWIQGMNRMDLILTTSEHSKGVLAGTEITVQDQDGTPKGLLKLEKPIEVLHNCIHTDIFRKIGADEISNSINQEFSQIKEDFCFLFVGHWLAGGLRHDRKNVGLLVDTFCRTFSNIRSPKRPALILKTSGAGFSIVDREEILSKISAIRDQFGTSAPNVYVLHGDLSDVQMNEVYNHPKVKAHVSFTKGEGFGRPLLEATMSKKPVIASGWSGHMDFLNPKDAILLAGEIKQVDQGSVWPGVIIPESSWFNVDEQFAMKALLHVYQNHSRTFDGTMRLAKKNSAGFSYQAIYDKTVEIFDKYVPKFAVPIPMKLPSLKKVG